MREIKNKILRERLDEIGLTSLRLYKADGYFFIFSDDDEMRKRLDQLQTTSIYVYSFNQLSVDQWIEEIKLLLESPFVSYTLE